jgi:hypothetical protein
MRKVAKALFVGGMTTPRGWALRAVLILITLAALHVLGWREDTRIISGTAAPKDLAGELAAMRGVVYGLVYFAGMIVAPILILAAGIRWAAARAMSRE